MPYIIKNGKTYTGNSVTLTQAQYDALSEAEKNNGTAYYIYDSDAVLDASDVGLGEGTVEDLAGSVATIETSPTVTNHVVGEHILWNGQLYEVISAIGAGADLTVNTNISATSVGEELSSLKNGLIGFPNYSDVIASAVTINSGTAVYTATRKCILLLNVFDKSRVYKTFNMNGHVIINHAATGATTDSPAAVTYPLFMKAGDVLTASALSADNWVVIYVYGCY